MKMSEKSTKEARVFFIVGCCCLATGAVLLTLYLISHPYSPTPMTSFETFFEATGRAIVRGAELALRTFPILIGLFLIRASLSIHEEAVEDEEQRVKA